MVFIKEHRFYDLSFVSTKVAHRNKVGMSAKYLRSQTLEFTTEYVNTNEMAVLWLCIVNRNTTATDFRHSRLWNIIQKLWEELTLLYLADDSILLLDSFQKENKIKELYRILLYWCRRRCCYFALYQVNKTVCIVRSCWFWWWCCCCYSLAHQTPSENHC